jgi:peptide/nickel transport system substrate-binding protein
VAQPRPGGTFTARQTTNPPTLDIHRTTAGSSEQIAGSAMSRLLQYKADADPKVSEDHEIEPDAALSVETPDAVTWTVKLRPNAKFHNIAPVNGRALEAEDVKATFVRAIDPKNPGRSAYDMIDTAAIQSPAPDTVVFKLNYPYALFRDTLASSTYGWILPREALAGAYDPATKVIGSGPFIADTFTPDVSYTLKRNPDWHLQGRPYVDALQWAIIPNIGQAEAQFAGGHLDLLGRSSVPDHRPRRYQAR